MDKREFLIGIISMLNTSDDMTEAERLVISLQKNNLILSLSQIIAKEPEPEPINMRDNAWNT